MNKAGRGESERGLANILMLFPGPVYDPQDYFRARLEGLSERYRGSVVSFSDKAGRVRIGRFEVELISSGRGGRLGAMRRLLQSVFRISRRESQSGRQIDLVITYDPLRTGLVGWIVARLTRAGLVIEVNGDYTALANYAEIKNPVQRWLKRRLCIAVERFILARANGIKLLYPDQIDYFRKSLHHPVVRAFPNYVDVSDFRDLGEMHEVLLVGFPFKVKGVDLLIDAFKQVADQHPEWRLKILGWYPDTTEMTAAIAGHPRIAHHPPVSRAEVAGHIGRCGIFVLPSRTEAMGRVLLEAMACGKPRIGTRVGGIPTVIEHEEDGLLVEPEDVPALAHALDRLMSDEALRRRLGARGRERANREFRRSDYVQRMIALCDEVSVRRHRRFAGEKPFPDDGTGQAKHPR